MVNVNISSCKGIYFAHHRVKHSDLCCFKSVTYVALTPCCEMRLLYIDQHENRPTQKIKIRNSYMVT